MYGGLDLHGVGPSHKWSRLATTANVGDTTLTVEDTVDWAVGNEILVTTTDMSPWHTETFTISAISGTSITLNGTVQYKHIGMSSYAYTSS